VSAKLTPKICINNAASNRRLTAAGRQAIAADTILRTVSRLFFFLFLTTFDERTTELHLHAEKLTETLLHLNLGQLVGFLCVCVCVCLVLFYFMCPFDETTTEQHLRHHLQDWTPKLLRQKLHCI
jgi:hypothetical protein